MVAVMEVTIMIRLSFEDDDEILSPSQKSEGLNLCWLLLKPELHKTISDLTSHILHGFQLHNSCPHGIHLYMDGFPLPPFESTGILSISDIISVRKKRPTLSLEASLKGQEAGKYQLRGLEEGGNATSMKRKASANIHITKKKKQRSALQDSVQDDATANQVLKSSQDKVRSSQENIQTQEHNPKNKKQAKDGKDKITNSNMETSADPKSSGEIKNSANDALEGPVETKKVFNHKLAFSQHDQTKKVGTEVLSAHNELHLDNTIDFDKLPPLCNLSKAGDVIVYRLLELSSSWKPELSPFRVGKVSWCSSETGKLLLMPVPEYPISSGMSVDDESDRQPDNSSYNEDGSLEIDFTALVDVRLLKDGSGCLTTAFGFPVDDAALVVPSASNDTQSNVSTKNGEAQPGKLNIDSSTENGVDIREQVSEALKAKKAELSKERTKNTLSYRTKGSALGPTMALLRKKKQCSGVQDSVQDDAIANKVQKSSHDKVESSQVNIQKQELNLKKKKQAMDGKDNINSSNMKISADTKSSDEIQNNANDASEGPMETKKTSRSARRKKAKRQWLRESKVQKQDEIVQNGLQSSKETLAVSKVDTSQPKSCVLKSSQDKVRSSQENIQKQEHNPKNKKQAKDGKDKITNNNMETSADPKSSDEIKISANGALEGPAETKKGSRSARRKAAKRRWLREFLKVEKQNETVQNGLKYSKKTLTLTRVDDSSQPESYQREEQTQPKSERKNQKGKRDDGELKGLEHFKQWNGITNKKKGQKWGKERHVLSNSNRKDNYETQELDADKLPPLCNLPKAGDVIVYRLPELSSSWTPVLSPFWVGKVSWCSSETGKLLLMPVPEYPISSGTSVDDESDSQPDNSHYNEDGSLEIDFTALVDVRLLKDGGGGLTTAFGFPVDVAALVVPSASNDTKSSVSTNEDVEQTEEHTRPRSERNNRNGKRDDGEPKGINSRTARRKKAKGQLLRESKMHGYGYRHANTRFLESRMHRYGYVDTRCADTKFANTRPF